MALGCQLLLGAIDVRRIVSLRNRTYNLDHIRDLVRVCDDDLARRLLAEIRKFFQHLLRRAIEELGFTVGVLEFQTGQNDTPVNFVLRIQVMRVAGSADRLAAFFTKLNDPSIELPQLFLVLDHALLNHERVVADRLNLQVVVEVRDFDKLRFRSSLPDRGEQLPSFTGRAENESLSQLLQSRPRNTGVAAVVFEI